MEIYFDNEQRRLPVWIFLCFFLTSSFFSFFVKIEKDEVIIRREMGLKVNDYFIDNKHVQFLFFLLLFGLFKQYLLISHSYRKEDVVNLLESAGISQSNPFFIVPQGKVFFLPELFY